MMPPILRRPGRPEHFRLMLIVYAIRHVLGVAVFGYLIHMALRIEGPFWIVLSVLCAAYFGYVIYGTIRLWGQYRRSTRAAKFASTARVQGE